MRYLHLNNRHIVALALAAAAINGASGTDQPEGQLRPLDIHLFHSLRRISLPVVSPDQAHALYTTSGYDPDTNKESSWLCLLDLQTGNKTQLTPNVPGDERISNPVWLRKGAAGYLKGGVLYQHPLTAETNGTVLFNATVNIASITYRTATDTLFFTAGVYPDGVISNMHKFQAVEKARSDSAQVYDNLWARHWNKWMTMIKSNVFAISLKSSDAGVAMGGLGSEVNLMRKLAEIKDPLIRWDAEGYTVSDDGRYVAFVVRNPSLEMVWSTNVDIYLVPADGSAAPKLLTGKYAGISSSPAFSPDGAYLAWLQMETPGYESDINRIIVYHLETATVKSIARDWTLSPQAIVWSADSQRLYALTPALGDRRVFSVDVDTGERHAVTGYGYVSGVARVGGDRLLALYSNTTESTNIQMLSMDGNPTPVSAPTPAPASNVAVAMRRLTDVNGDRLRGVYLSESEDFWFAGARNESVHGWLLRPHGFNETRKYPMALLIHGGPQQASSHVFGMSQWNPNMYASAGFVTVVINFHGSSGYGQNFTDSIHEQWGGYPYDDLMRGVDHVLREYGFVDPARLVALGASYGGYMVNWINGNTDRFAALVAHDGQFNTVAGYYSTDELWFIEHDLGGVPFTRAGRPKYEAYNPERLAGRFRTPTMFIHGANDFRLTLEQSLAGWTLLRRKGIPARLVYYPDEDHWTNKMGNSVRWYTEVFGWF
ncbi:dipeptidylpeptidase [Coemansia sp. Benny D115]|nr:dipeptidylpeptidase [Coemansia sp. Benny D115]